VGADGGPGGGGGQDPKMSIRTVLN
jgi:hypothetical protein